MISETREDTKADKRIPWYFVAFFVGLAILNVIFVTIAVKSYPDLVTENAYEKGLDYNTMIETKQAQDALGWQSDFKIMDQKIILFLTNKDGNFLSGANITAEAGRIIHGNDDHALTFVENANGYYESQEKFAIKGRWNIKAHIQWKQDKIQIKKHVQVK